MNLKISPNNIIGFMVIYSIIMNALVAELNLPSIIFYINDLLNCILFIMIFRKQFWNFFINIRFKSYLAILMTFIITIFLGNVINMTPLRLIIWGGRNTFRTLVFFIACTMFLRYEKISKIYNYFFILQITNFILGLYQYFVLGLSQDLLGGIFGHGNGNALNIYCVVVVASSFLLYLQKKEPIYKTIICFLTSIVLAALAEEKFMFFALIIVVVLALILSGRVKGSGIKKLLIIPIFILGLVAGYKILLLYFPKAAATLLDFQLIKDYTTASWSDSYYFPRVGSFSKITEELFHNNFIHTLFGFGMGNCDTSSFPMFESDFYKQYGYMHYRWLTHQWTYLELGGVGFILFLLLLLAVLIYLFKNRKKVSDEKLWILDTAIICVVICIATIWYNNTLKVDTAYIPYFVMGAGIVVIRDSLRKKRGVK